MPTMVSMRYYDKMTYHYQTTSIKQASKRLSLCEIMLPHYIYKVCYRGKENVAAGARGATGGPLTLSKAGCRDLCYCAAL
ncbi:MAG: hypothetical protein ACTIIO_07970, partial [Psychrobacter celer]